MNLWRVLRNHELLTTRMLREWLPAAFLACHTSLAVAALPEANGTASCSRIAQAYQSWSASGGKIQTQAHRGTTSMFTTRVIKGKGGFDIPGQAAYDCLKAMPFRPDLALKFLDE